jgi:hypothetical protein
MGVPPRVHSDCLAQVANLWAKPEYCDGIEFPTDKARCRGDLAEKLGDLKLCKRSGTPEATKRCLRTLAARAEDPSICTQSTDASGVDDCMNDLAIASMRGELCAPIKSASQRESCVTEVIKKRGEDMALCESLVSPEHRSECYLAAATHGNITACLKVPPEKRAKCFVGREELLDDLGMVCEGSVACLSGMAYTGTAACELIPTEPPKPLSDCLTAALERPAGWTRDSHCTRMRTQGRRDACFAILGRKAGHGGACMKILDAKLRTECLFAAGRSDASRCLALSDTTEAKACVIQSMLSNTNNVAVCKLLAQEKQKDCERRVASQLEREIRDATR